MFSDRRGSPRAKKNLTNVPGDNFSDELLFLLLLFSWCHDKLGVPGTERGPAGGAVAAVGRAAAARADRDIGVRISPANTSSGSAATSPPV